VVEPHGNGGQGGVGSVYADAKLPDGFTPADWASDFNPDYPSEDRQQILVFNDTGTTASIDAGSHAFAWRLPGVIAGAITAVLLYILARILFRRRLIAGLVGLFVLVDGMFFVQSRIGMNDVYVGLFIDRRLHRVRRALDGLVARAAPRSGWGSRSSACCSGSRSRANGSRPMPSAPSSC
jgi:hypothetical protein